MSSFPHRPPAPDFVGKDLNATLPEMRHLLVFADFEDRAQPFQNAFAAKARSIAETCRFAIDFDLVEHATTPTLDPPKIPSPSELAAKAAALGADGLLRTKVTNWSGGGAPGTTRSALVFGRFSLSITLSQEPSGKAVWTGTFQQDVDNGSGGGALADQMLNRFARQGAFPSCAAVGAKAGRGCDCPPHAA